MAQGGTGHVKVLSRSDGRSATAAAAYRAATIIQDDRTGLAFDYRKKQGVLEVLSFHPPVQLAPGEAKPAWMERLEALDEYWNKVEQAETRKNSRVAREFLVPLPHELTRAQRVDLAQRISDQIAARYQVAGTACIHAPDKGGDDRNFHVHILFPTRRINLQTGELGEKTRELDDKVTGPEEIVWLMGMGESEINWALEAAGIERRVDWRSIEARHAEAVANGDLVQAAALNYSPQVHEGSRVTQIRRDAEKRAAVSGDSVVESLVGECDLIAFNEGAKELKAAALEHAAALAEVAEARASLIEAEALFEEARRAAELARVGLGDDLASDVGYLESSEDEGEIQEAGQVVDLAEYRESQKGGGQPKADAPLESVISAEPDDPDERLPEQMGFDLIPEPEQPVFLEEVTHSIEAEHPELNAEEKDDEWGVALSGNMFPVSAQEEVRQVVTATVGRVINRSVALEDDEDVAALKGAMDSGLVALLAARAKKERDEIIRQLQMLMNQEKMLKPVPHVPQQTLAGLLRDFLASIPGLGWIGVSRHTRAMQELAAHNAAQQQLASKREDLEQKAELLEQSVPLASRQDAETLIKNRAIAAAAEVSLPKQRKENDSLLKQLEQEKQMLKSDEAKGLASLPGFGWVGASEREQARRQKEKYRLDVAQAEAQREKLDRLQKVLEALHQSIAADEQRPGMTEQLQAIKDYQEQIEEARRKWARAKADFSSALSSTGYQLKHKAQREIERGNREWAARHEDDRRVISAAIVEAQGLAQSMLQEAESLQNRMAENLTDDQALEGFKPTKAQLDMLEQGQEQLQSLPLLAGQMEEQRELQRRADRVESPKDAQEPRPFKQSEPKL